MISLFKRERAYEIAVGEEPKPAEPVYPKNLMKVQYKGRLLIDHTASSVGSITVISQSGESTNEAPHLPAPPALSRDNIKNLYQSHK